MTTRTGADLFVESLAHYGVSHVFGNPGTTELPIVRAISESDVEYILGVHEDIAVGMAAGYAQTRRYHADDDDSVLPIGVANLHLAPGLAHGLANVVNASFTGAPVLVTAGNHGRGFRHEEPILSGDQLSMVDQFTKYSAEVLDVDALPTMLRRAVRVALTPPTGPVFLSLPLDVMQTETDEMPERLGTIPTPGTGDPTDIEDAAEAIVAAEEPAMVLGDEIARSGTDAVDAAVALAEASGASVHGEALQTEVNFPTDHEQWVSHLLPSETMLRSAMETDTLIFVGISTNTTLSAYDEALVDPETSIVHVGQNAREIGKNHPADVAVLGDPGAVMNDLAKSVEATLTESERTRRLETVRSTKQENGTEQSEETETNSPNGLASKAQLVDAIRSAVPDAFVVDESVTSKYVLMRRWPFDAQQFVSNKGGGLGYGVPAAIGAAIAEGQRDEPRDVVGFIGDGTYFYYPNAIYTAARYDIDLTVVVSDNRNYRILKENAGKLFDMEPENVPLVGVDFDPPVDIAANAESYGATGKLVESPDDIQGAVEEAVDTDGPVVLDVLVHD